MKRDCGTCGYAKWEIPKESIGVPTLKIRSCQCKNPNYEENRVDILFANECPVWKPKLKPEDPTLRDTTSAWFKS